MTKETNEIYEAPFEQVERLMKFKEQGMKNGYIALNGMSNIDWIVLRSLGWIGASDIATALGKTPAYFGKTPLKLWKEKVGHIIDLIDKPILRIGRNIEETIVKEYEYLTGRKVQRERIMHIHKEHEFLFTNLDGIIEPAGGDDFGVLECKSTVSYIYETWKQKIPSYYFRQVMGEMSVMGYDYTDIAILILDKREVEIIRINRDNEFIENQNDELAKWYYDYVVNNIPPPESVSEWAKTEPMEDSFTEATPKTYANYEELLRVRRQLADVKERKEELDEAIKAEMKDYETLIYSGEIIATWKAQPKNRLNTKKLKEEKLDVYEEYLDKSLMRVFRPKEIAVLEY